MMTRRYTKLRRPYSSIRAYLQGEQVLQSELAKRAGITQGYISLLLANRRQPSFQVARKLAALTNVPLELIGVPAKGSPKVSARL